MRKAVYPGTFDPVTNGHLDIIKRASQIFDHIIVGVSESVHKKPLFTLAEREALVIQAVQELDNVEVFVFNGLLVNFAENINATAIIRGLRAVSDFEYEFQMALMNRKLKPKLETVYLMPSEEYSYIDSTIVKEVAQLGGRMDCFLPQHVANALVKKMKKR